MLGCKEKIDPIVYGFLTEILFHFVNYTYYEKKTFANKQFYKLRRAIS